MYGQQLELEFLPHDESIVAWQQAHLFLQSYHDISPDINSPDWRAALRRIYLCSRGQLVAAANELDDLSQAERNHLLEEYIDPERYDVYMDRAYLLIETTKPYFATDLVGHYLFLMTDHLTGFNQSLDILPASVIRDTVLFTHQCVEAYPALPAEWRTRAAHARLLGHVPPLKRLPYRDLPPSEQQHALKYAKEQLASLLEMGTLPSYLQAQIPFNTIQIFLAPDEEFIRLLKEGDRLYYPHRGADRVDDLVTSSASQVIMIRGCTFYECWPTNMLI
jgi:hypothetical protein